MCLRHANKMRSRYIFEQLHLSFLYDHAESPPLPGREEFNERDVINTMIFIMDADNLF